MRDESPPAKTRIACLLVPALPIAARLRVEPDLAGRPVAIVSESGARGVVLSVSDPARRIGIHPGASLSHARAVCGDLVVRVAQPALERAARAALQDVALSASPRVALLPPGTGHAASAAVVLDAGGLGRVFASETALASALVARAHAQGLPAVAAVAASRALAEVAARHAACESVGTTRVVAAGDETKFLAPLSVDLLGLDDAAAETLTRFGIYRLGALLALAPAPLATRIGASVVARLAALRGAREEPPIPAPRSLRLEESVSLDAPIGALEPFLFALGGILSRLFARLALRHLACAELELELACGAARHSLRVCLAAPSTDTRVWLRRVHLALERDPPPGGVDAIGVATEGRPARHDQLDLFRPAGPAPAVLDSLLAELEILCGEGRVGTPHVPDHHHPDALSITPFEQPTSSELDRGNAHASGAAVRGGGARSEPKASEAHPGRQPPTPPPTLALRALRPPLPVHVHLRGGQPSALRSAIANGDVVRCAGPWRTTGGWWTEADRFAFDSYDVATSDGLLVRLRHDRLRDIWQVDAVYD
jgi:protein ImuB